jgi:ribosome modulation factor
MTIDSVLKALNEGRAAHLAGTPYNKCPYVRATAESNAWKRGWLQARSGSSTANRQTAKHDKARARLAGKDDD